MWITGLYIHKQKLNPYCDLSENFILQRPCSRLSKKEGTQRHCALLGSLVTQRSVVNSCPGRWLFSSWQIWQVSCITFCLEVTLTKWLISQLSHSTCSLYMLLQRYQGMFFQLFNVSHPHQAIWQPDPPCLHIPSGQMFLESNKHIPLTSWSPKGLAGD